MPVAEVEFEEGPYGPVDGELVQDEQNLMQDETILTNDDSDEPAPMEPPLAPRPTKPIVGIIYPPPEVRNIVDKTASFVARNGPEFETRIRQNEQNNPKFNFLNSGDPYHAYYLHKVKEIQEGKAPAVQPSTPSAPIEAPGPKPGVPSIDEIKKKKQSELLKQVELPFVPKDPPAEFEFIADPPSISAQDLDVVKLTAQFVARNGRQFLSTLMTREQRNYQFDFLRPQHSLFQYFTKLLEQYTKVLIPPKDIVKKLEKEDGKKLLADVKYRANWIKHQEAQKRKEEEEAEKERLAYASIDWHDFVVVETVDYQPFESGNFPPPTTPQEVGARVLLQDRILQGQAVAEETSVEDNYAAQDDTEVQDMEEDSSSSEEEEDEQQASKPTLPGIIPEERGEVIIKKGYDPKQAKAVPGKAFAAGAEEYTISPITGERIPVSKLQEHVRIGLLDPRWREQNWRNVLDKANQESPYAVGSAIDESLKLLAERRSDIFGTGVEETAIGKKAGEDERVPGMPWVPTPDISSQSQQSSVTAAPPVQASEDSNDESLAEHSSASQEPSHTTVTSQSASQPAAQPTALQNVLPSQPPMLHPPGSVPPPLSQLPGIVRPLNLPPPPGQQPPPPPGVMLQPMGGVRPLLGIPTPGFPQFAPAPPGTMGHRPPLLTPAPPVLPPMGGPPPQISITQTIPPVIAPPPAEDEPASKKAKTEDSLIPEEEFLATNPSPVTFTIAMPSVPDKPEMNLNGQLVTFNMELTELISNLKSKISNEIGLAPGKQKLRLHEGVFFKDSNTLAFYNVGEGSNVHLSLKERGGRKK